MEYGAAGALPPAVEEVAGVKNPDEDLSSPSSL